MTLPILYSFKRCPYAIRARMGLHVSGIAFETIEVDLKNKPPEMLALSPKGTVPVLKLPDGKVLEESLHIMEYALSQNDPEEWLPDPEQKSESDALIAQNDTVFKRLLDKYKYHTRHPEKSQAEHRAQGEAILREWEMRLQSQCFLLCESRKTADVALFPFVRQWAGVQKGNLAAFPNLSDWLQAHLDLPVFIAIMA